MKYKTFRQQGYLIGSGAMESAIRNVVQHRLKRSGQRWTVNGGQQVLNLRTLFLSNLENMVIDKIKLTALYKIDRIWDFCRTPANPDSLSIPIT
jgi:hypothetical protein